LIRNRASQVYKHRVSWVKAPTYTGINILELAHRIHPW
jgi:hypothetical protein